MTYDGLDRLKTANAPGVWGNASYSYDAVDNLTVANVGSRTVGLSYDAKNRLSSATINGVSVPYGYDPRGNITGKGPQSYAFDLGNRLKSVGSTQGYVYDGHGRRVRVIAGANGTRIQVYTNDGKLMWSTNSATGSSTAYIYLGGKQIAEWEKTGTTATTRYLHTDALGSPVARSNASGGLINRTRYEAYGNVAAGVEPGPGVGLLGFTGHVQDQETDLVYMQQRYYDPIAGRFLSVDPIVTDADTGKLFGRYHYAESNPYSYIDPDGRLSCGPRGDNQRGGDGGGECPTDPLGDKDLRDPFRRINAQFDGDSPSPPSKAANSPGGPLIDPSREEVAVYGEVAVTVASFTPVGAPVRILSILPKGITRIRSANGVVFKEVHTLPSKPHAGMVAHTHPNYRNVLPDGTVKTGVSNKAVPVSRRDIIDANRPGAQRTGVPDD
jgi:RHS repeat-associated protein